MSAFDQAFANLDQVEGGYVKDPDDPGGETYRGISRKRWPHWAGWAIIDTMKHQPGFPENLKTSVIDEHVKDFYRTNFWEAINGDILGEISPAIAREMFDTEVNTGTKGEFLQRELNALNYISEHADLKVDGAVGPQTLAALDRFLHIRGEAGESVILAGLNAQQHTHYMDIAERSPSQRKFFFGWVAKRVVKPA